PAVHLVLSPFPTRRSSDLSHYELGQFTEAALAYEQFVKLHPKHPQVDYSLFRVGESYWQDSPEEIDREQEYTLKAIDEWQKLIADRKSTRLNSSHVKISYA